MTRYSANGSIGWSGPLPERKAGTMSNGMDEQKRKPIHIELDLNYREGDKVRITREPYFSGDICSVEIHLNHLGKPYASYRVRTDTPKRVSRYVGESNLILLSPAPPKGATEP